MSEDETLDEVELRVEEAKGKLAWFEEEYRELQLSPVFRDFQKFYGKWEGLFTPEEKARRLEVRNSVEWGQFLLNEHNRMVALKELTEAKRELLEYKIRYKKFVKVPIHRNANVAADGESCAFCLGLFVTHFQRICSFDSLIISI